MKLTGIVKAFYLDSFAYGTLIREGAHLLKILLHM